MGTSSHKSEKRELQFPGIPWNSEFSSIDQKPKLLSSIHTSIAQFLTMGSGGRGGKSVIQSDEESDGKTAASPQAMTSDFKDFAFRDETTDRGIPSSSAFVKAQTKRKLSETVVLEDSESDGWMDADVNPKQVAQNQAIAAANRKNRIVRTSTKDAALKDKSVPVYRIPKRQRVVGSEEEDEIDDEGSFDTAGEEDDDEDDIVDTPVAPKARPRIVDKSGFPVYDASAFDAMSAAELGLGGGAGGVQVQVQVPAGGGQGSLEGRESRMKNDRAVRAQQRAASKTKKGRRIKISPTGSGDEGEEGGGGGGGGGDRMNASESSDDSGSGSDLAAGGNGNGNSDSDSESFATGDANTTQNDIKAGADRVLRKCKSYSETLRNAIVRWEASASTPSKTQTKTQVQSQVQVQVAVVADMSIKELRQAVAQAGLQAKTAGFLEKAEFVALLQQHGYKPKPKAAATSDDPFEVDSGSDSDDATGAGAPGDRENRGCLSLVAINATQSSAVLGPADFPFLTAQGLSLKPYQVVGVNWMRLLHESHVNGVLADDMGLGKTVQTAAFLGWLEQSARLRGHASEAPHLIVVPASTLSNWELELKRCCPALKVLTYHGSQDERYQIRRKWRSASNVQEKKGGVRMCDIVLSTYTIFERESSSDDRSFLYKQQFSYLVLDEAHCIKNPSSLRYVNLTRLRSSHRLLLSGTPVQNNISELLALLSFLMPKVFKRASCELLLASFNLKKGNNSSNASLMLLRKMLVPFVLRRLKRDVLDQLTDKQISVEILPMLPTQAKIYDSIIAGYLSRKQRALAKQQDEKNDELSWGLDPKSASSSSAPPRRSASSSSISSVKRSKVMVDLTDGDETVSRSVTGSGADADNDGSKEILAVDPEAANQLMLYTESIAGADLGAKEARHLFTALRKAANHPLLLRVHYRDDNILQTIAMAAMAGEHFGTYCTTTQAKEEILEKFNDYDIHQLCLEYGRFGGVDRYCLQEDALFDSPKFMWLREHLPRLIKEGHHILIFSQWTRILDLLELLMSTIRCDLPLFEDSVAPQGISFLRLDGSTPVSERQALINRFNSGAIPIFLLSTKAGGLGINLTTADTVIMHDLDFNPENDRQAEDRAHRIGQMRDVRVFKLVAAGSVDEDIHAMGERKRELTEGILNSKAGKGSAGKKEKEDGDDINTIGKILQGALQRRTNTNK